MAKFKHTVIKTKIVKPNKPKKKVKTSKPTTETTKTVTKGSKFDPALEIKKADRLIAKESRKQTARSERNAIKMQKLKNAAERRKLNSASQIIKQTGSSLSQNVLAATPLVATIKDDNELINSTSVNENSTGATNPNVNGSSLSTDESIYGNWRY